MDGLPSASASAGVGSLPSFPLGEPFPPFPRFLSSLGPLFSLERDDFRTRLASLALLSAFSPFRPFRPCFPSSGDEPFGLLFPPPLGVFLTAFDVILLVVEGTVDEW